MLTLLVSRRCLSAELVEGSGQVSRDVLGVAIFDVATLHEIDELAIAKEADRGRRGGIVFKIAASLLGGVAVLAGKNADRLVGHDGVFEGKAHARPHTAGGATAH